MKEQTAIISSAAILRINHLFFGDQQVYMCRNVLLNKVLENNITICSNKKECKELQLEKNEMDKIWIPLCKDIVDSIMMLGIVAIRFREDDNMPYVPKAGTYTIHVVTTVSGISRYELHDMDNPNEIVPNSIVLSGFGYDPRANGSLKSMIKTLEPTMVFIHRLSDAALQAEETRCNPPILVERREKATEAKEGLEFDFYLDSDNLKSNLSAQYRRDEKAVKQLERQRMLFANAIQGIDSSSARNTSKAINNIVPLPNEYHFSTAVDPSGRNDYVQICRMASETICSILGVPRSMIISDNVVRGDVDGSHDVFKNSCMQWKNILGSILTAIYRRVNVEKEANRLKKLSKKRKRSDDNVDNFANQQMVEVVVPVTPYISNEELKDLYLHKIIPWSVYKEYTLRNASLPLDMLKSNEKDPWSDDDKKELLGISSKPEPISQGSAMKNSGSSSMKAGDKSISKTIAKNK